MSAEMMEPSSWLLRNQGWLPRGNFVLPSPREVDQRPPLYIVRVSRPALEGEEAVKDGPTVQPN